MSVFTNAYVLMNAQFNASQRTWTGYQVKHMNYSQSQFFVRRMKTRGTTSFKLWATIHLEISWQLCQKNAHCQRDIQISVRVTTVGVLREQGFSNEEIAPVTGHKNVASVQRYVKKRKGKMITTSSFQKHCRREARKLSLKK